MKKKIATYTSLFLLTISLILGGCFGILNINKDGQSHILADSSESTKKDLLSISGDVPLEVGGELDFSDKFKLYVRPADKENLTYEIENEEIIYLTKTKHKLIGLQAGTTKVVISTDKYKTTLNIIVNDKNFCTDGTFEDYAAGTRWTAMDEDNFGWRLYTGKSAVQPDQLIEILDDNGNNVVHYKHTAATQYTSLYKSFEVEPGQYYVTAKMKGQDILKDTYVRVNQGNKMGISQTQKVKGTFDWQTFRSEIIRVMPGEKLKLEMYFALNQGEVWFDDLQIHKIITTDYTSFTVLNPVIKLNAGGTAAIETEMFPESKVDYDFNYSSDNEAVATVDRVGNVKAIANGVTNIKITDVKNGTTKTAMVVIGTENGIDASFNGGDVLNVLEDSTNELELTVQADSSYKLYKYNEPVYGNYYIKDNKIYYSPKADFYTTNAIKDSFKVLVLDEAKGYRIVDITITIKGVDDTPEYIDFWHTTDKNTPMVWSKTNAHTNYSSHGLYNGGYLQVVCQDIEAIYPARYKKHMVDQGLTEEQYRKNKEAMYNNVVATGKKGELEFKTENGGTITLRDNGMAQEVQDRYYDSQGKLIHAVLYDYTPKADFYGYDHFDLVIKNGEKSITVRNTVYVAPAMEDFSFDKINFDGVYLLSNEAWLKDTRNGLKDGDPVITEWVNYYKSQYNVHVPSGVPAKARTPMEQLAILYQITGEKKYFDMAWAEMLPIIKDEAFSGDGTRRLSWGEDSNGFLDAAMVTYSVALTYNYIKDALTAEQKLQVMKALYEEGFYYFENIQNPNVLLHGNNHNLLVCGNLAIAALSAMSYDGEIKVMTRDDGEQTVNVRQMAANVVSTAFKFLQIGLVHYSESGGFPEGPAYSIYAHRNMVSLLATLRNLYGETNGKINSFGLSDIKGIMDYVNYPLYTSSPNYESFYYTESEYSNNQPALLWYTRIDPNNYNAALLSKLAHENEQYNIQSLLYYTPGLFDRVNASEILKLDYLLEDHELATFRSEFGNEMGIFTGLKGTDSKSGAFTHKNLDSGTFEIYALGERFIGNYSNETYNVVVPDGYWDYDYQRWTYYKKNVQGQNTLVFNPEKNPVLMQDPNEKAPITRFESNKNSGLSVIDLSRVYKKDALRVERGLKLFNNRQNILVQDEFELRDYSTMYWSAHTEARIDLIDEKTVRLTLNGKSLYAVITSELGTWDYMSATALPGTIGDFCNLDNEGVNKLIIKLDNVLNGTLSVLFVSSLEDLESFGDTTVTPIKDWKLDAEAEISKAQVKDIKIKAPLGDKYKYTFNPNQYDYVVKLAYGETEVPDLEVEYDEIKYEVTISKSPIFNSISKVIVKDKATGVERCYNYKFIVDTITKDYDDYRVIEVANITGSKGVDKLIDGNSKTSFTSYKKEEIILELKDTDTITNVLIRFNGGLINTYYFDIYYSEDGVNYKSCYNAGQSTNNIGDEVYTLGNVKAKFIKIVLNGNIKDDKLALSEIRLLNNGHEFSAPANGNGGNLALILGITGGVAALGAVIAVVTVVLVKRRKK